MNTTVNDTIQNVLSVIEKKKAATVALEQADAEIRQIKQKSRAVWMPALSKTFEVVELLECSDEEVDELRRMARENLKTVTYTRKVVDIPKVTLDFPKKSRGPQSNDTIIQRRITQECREAKNNCLTVEVAEKTVTAIVEKMCITKRKMETPPKDLNIRIMKALIKEYGI